MKVEELIGGYKKIVLPRDKALELVISIIEDRGSTRDLEETRRIITKFDEFYRIQIKHDKSYLTPSKDMSELIKGLVVIDKIKLIRKDEKEFVEMVFDKRVSSDYINRLVRILSR